MGSSLVQSVQLGEFPQNCIPQLASMLFLLRSCEFCGEGDENSVGRLKAIKATLGSSQPCQLNSLNLVYLPQNITFRFLFLSVFLEPSTLRTPPPMLPALQGKE